MFVRPMLSCGLNREAAGFRDDEVPAADDDDGAGCGTDDRGRGNDDGGGGTGGSDDSDRPCGWLSRPLADLRAAASRRDSLMR